MTVHQANKYTDAAKENIPKIISMYQISIRHLPNTKHFKVHVTHLHGAPSKPSKSYG